MNLDAETKFNYSQAFGRNFGFLSGSDQEVLRNARVGIAGLGGAGGMEAHALARLGIGHFHLADLDRFELSNFNRQMGASLKSIGRKKTEVTKEMIESINPGAEVTVFGEGIYDPAERFQAVVCQALGPGAMAMKGMRHE